MRAHAKRPSERHDFRAWISLRELQREMNAKLIRKYAIYGKIDVPLGIQQNGAHCGKNVQLLIHSDTVCLCTRTHTRACTRAPVRTRTPALVHTYAHACMHSCTRTHTHSRTRTPVRKRTPAFAHPHAHARIHSRTRTHARACIRAPVRTRACTRHLLS